MISGNITVLHFKPPPQKRVFTRWLYPSVCLFVCSFVCRQQRSSAGGRERQQRCLASQATVWHTDGVHRAPTCSRRRHAYTQTSPFFCFLPNWNNYRMEKIPRSVELVLCVLVADSRGRIAWSRGDWWLGLFSVCLQAAFCAQELSNGDRLLLTRIKSQICVAWRHRSVRPSVIRPVVICRN